jgi:EmrB/QacA subfamily drug resistance transporter
VSERNRWLALYMLCAGELLIVLDTTVVNVALPSIRADLGFSEAALVWVVNAYMVTYGGFLLLGGRLGDLYGRRRLFLLGTAVFTLASLACGLSGSQEILVAARAVQGLGGAVVSAIALSLIMDLFTEPGERAKAMGIYGFVCAGGGSIGVLAGGVLTSMFGWNWVFLVNLPLGIAVYAACARLLPADAARAAAVRLDLAGAGSITAASMLAVYGIVNGSVALTAAAAALLALFLFIETRVSQPLMPLRLFRLRSVAAANAIGVLWAAAMFAWFFITALYLQQARGYDAMQVGLAFLPANLIMAVFSIWLSAKMVMRFGIRLPIVLGMLLSAAGLGAFVFGQVLAGMLLLGLGCGMALNPVMLAGMSDVDPSESGLASGVLNTSFMMGGAIGLAALARISESSGYPAAFAIGAGFALLAALLAALFLRARAAATQEVQYAG